MSMKAQAVVAEIVVEHKAGIRGGAPVVAGTGIRVMDVAVRYEVMHQTPDEIMAALPQLTLAHIHAALSYYYAHKDRLDATWREAVRRTSAARRRHPSLLETKRGAVEILHR